MLRTWRTVILGVALPVAAWAGRPATLSPGAGGPVERSTPERLLPTPPVVIRFGWTTSDPDERLARLRASAETRTLLAPAPGILELACSPHGVIPWGACLFRIYDLELLGDLAAAAQLAARIGDQPVVIAPRSFPPPLMRSVRVVPLPPVLPAPPEVRAPESPGPPAQPIVRVPGASGRAENPELAREPSPSPVRSEPAPDPAPLRQASERLARAEERLSDMQALLSGAGGELRAAEQAAAPLRDDVAARRRLAESGVVARNDVKAAEERLRDAEAVVDAARGRVAEAQAAMHAAEAARDAALAGVESPKVPAPPPVAPPPTVASTPPAPAPPPPRRVSVTPLPVPAETTPVDPFPSPLASGSGVLPPAPTETLRLARRGDLPSDTTWAPLPWPDQSAALAQQRWHEQTAPWQCLVSRALVPQGSIVQKGTPVLELRQTSAARLTAEVAEPYVGFCQVGAPIEVTFPTVGLVYRGWVSHAEPTHAPRPPGAQIQVLLSESRAGDSQVYPDLEWLALLTCSSVLPPPQPLAYAPPEPTCPAPTGVGALFPLPYAVEDRAEPAPWDGQLSGTLQLCATARPSGFNQADPVAQRKLKRLQEWRDSFVEGMETTVFPEVGLTLTYPREGEVHRAVERMATRRVSHSPGMCARTLAEAFGWGLGDAALWAQRLPERGYRLREDGIARPGDILVWPYTYGARRSQHVGLAVGQGSAIMLLSNQDGVLGTAPLTGGYLAFYRPQPKATSGPPSKAVPAKSQPKPLLAKPGLSQPAS